MIWSVEQLSADSVLSESNICVYVRSLCDSALAP